MSNETNCDCGQTSCSAMTDDTDVSLPGPRRLRLHRATIRRRGLHLRLSDPLQRRTA